MSKKEVSRAYRGSFSVNSQDNFERSASVVVTPRLILLSLMPTGADLSFSCKEVLDYVIFDGLVLIRFAKGNLVVYPHPEDEQLHPDFREFLKNAMPHLSTPLL